jgi:hypothetical protein
MDVTCELERGLFPRAGANVVLAVQCRASSSDGKERPDLSIAAALDRSTSMRGAKLDDMKAALRGLVERLGPRDRLVLVAFDSGAEVLAAGPVVDRAPFLEKIDALAVRNGTNISLALETAGRFLQGDASGSAKRLLLLTDGEASAGDTSREGLARLSAGLVPHKIATTCLGFGLKYDEQTLDLVATAGAGRLHHVNERGKLAAIYGGELDRMRALAAPWVAVTVTPGEGARVHGSRNPYPMKRAGNGFELELADLSGAESRWVLFDLWVPPAAAGADEALLASVLVRWNDPSGEAHEKREDVIVRYADDATAARAEPNGEVLVQIALLDLAAANARALKDAEEGNFTAGTARLNHSVLRIASSTGRRDFGLEAKLARARELARKLENGQVDTIVKKEVQAEIQSARTPTFKIDMGDAPPI